ncbi:metal ABC transporter permease [Rhabdaerophilum sp. SD176]|uniref:metal ABC transporter permease n=1 Tax=Rhabdaerophilum sp. SD176 TaxID=2983548 RepID=UPI0024E020DF|nr:metal ABC transporter permease [Rhabdaerophilum sp. SD176]
MNAVLGFITQPLAHDFMQRGLVVALLVGMICAMLSCYLVLKGWSLMGDAVSHAVLPGIVLAFVAGLPLALGAFAAGLGCALATGYLQAHSRVREDAVMGIVFSGLFALGLVLFVKVETDQHLNHILFGNMLGVQLRDVAETALIALPAIAFLLVRRRDLMLYCFDPAHARAIGLQVGFLHYGLLVLLALTIVASLKAVGIILVIAMLIAPGAIGLIVTRRFGPMMVVAVLAATGSSLIGTLLSFHLDAATGPMIVVVQSLLFALLVVIRQVRLALAPH